ncbi:MAG: DUF4178 domain-containing protein [Candidatus Obscuribacterales bacterium]|nr:DUF4178 domain-containing protein [Candidatus Obscuribacterales bacterium]
MLSLNCSSCGATVNFHSKASVFAVCSFCKSTLVRHDMNLEAVGEMADLQDDWSPFQIGSQGVFDGKKFELVGRLRIAYSAGFWNEWFAWFDGERTAWLAEAQGFLALCFSSDTIAPNKDTLQPGKALTLAGQTFRVDDMRKVSCLFSEGELPVNAIKDRRSLSVDLRGPSDTMATIEYPVRSTISGVADEQPRVFVGKYKDFDEFKFKNLRKLDGW